MDKKKLEALLCRVMGQIKDDIDNGDVEAVEELLSFLPLENLIGFLPEEEWSSWK